MEKKVLSTLTVFLFIAFILLAVAILPSVSAVSFKIKKETIYDVVPSENISIPASYYLTIENINESDDSFKIYSIVDMELEPTEPFEIEAGESVTITVTMLPSVKIKERCGFGCGVRYHINSELSGAIDDTLNIKVVPIDKIIEIILPEAVTREDAEILINITNKENINFEKISINAGWDFCNTTKIIDLKPKSSTIQTFALDKTKIERTDAGNYTLKLTITVNDEYSYIIEESIMLEEFTFITTTESTSRGFLGYTKSITKKNEGNSARLITIEVTKSNFERIFTKYSENAAYENSTDGAVKIGWQRELEPGESFTVELDTNYSWFVLILVIIIGGVTALYLIKRPRFIIKKKAYKIKAKGGEFAVKLLIVVKNVGLEANDVRCIDYIPKLAKLHERFGAIKPDKIEKNKLEWNFGTVAPGEERIVSYIIYSDVEPVGVVTMPRAALSFVDSTGKKHHLLSNKAFASGAA